LTISNESGVPVFVDSGLGAEVVIAWQGQVRGAALAAGAYPFLMNIQVADEEPAALGGQFMLDPALSVGYLPSMLTVQRKLARQVDSPDPPPTAN
jgi:hypothetical protein